jgi:DHA1 family bicyclomycin/chloramphenicol resistance-like MFS transporter
MSGCKELPLSMLAPQDQQSSLQDIETAAAASARRRLLALLIAMTAIAPLTLNIIVPAIPNLAVELDAPADSVQLMVSLYLLVLALSQLALGPLSDRFGRRPVIIAGLTLTAVTSIAALLATNLSGLITARSLQGLGASTGLVVGRAIIRDLYHRDRAASMIASVTMVVIAAPMIAPLLGGFLDTLFGWQSIFIAIAAACFAVVAWTVLALPETRVPHPEAKPIRIILEIRALARERRFIGYVLCAALGTAPFFVFLGGGPHVVVGIMGKSSAEYGLWFAINAIGYLGGNFCAWRYSSWYGIDRMIWWGLLVSIGGVILSLSLTGFFPQIGPAALFVPQLIISLGNGLLLPNSFAGAVSVRPQAAGAGSGIAGFGQMAAGAAATQFATVALAGATGAFPLSVTMAAILIAATVSYLVLVRPRMLTAD